MTRFASSQNLDAISVAPTTSIRATLDQITRAAREQAPAGLALVIGADRRLLGIATDGDFRRAWSSGVDASAPIEKIMVRSPITVSAGLSDAEMVQQVVAKVQAAGRIRSFKVDEILVTDADGRVVAVRDFFELWQSLDQRSRTVCVVGMGFVGLTVGVALADVGFQVVGYDINERVVAQVSDGVAPFHEKGLASLLKFHVAKGGFKATTDFEQAQADIYLISVGTPVGPDNRPVLEPLVRAATSIGGALKPRDLVILRSTVPVGTTRAHVIPILERESGLKAGEDFHVCFAPERTVEGKALEELRTLPQIVGGVSRRSLEAGASFFAALSHTIVRVDSIESAEMVKLINNSFRDLSFAFANELAQACDEWNLDASRIVEAANRGYPRNPIPVPSPGVGGFCLRKDPYLYSISRKDPGTATKGLSALGREINEGMPRFVFGKLKRFVDAREAAAAGGKVKVFLIGFAFKGEPETSDLRDSPTVDLLREIQSKTSWEVCGFDPVVDRSELERLGVRGVSLREGFAGADVVAVLNNHRSYQEMDVLGLAETLKRPALFFDGWNLFPRVEIERVTGVSYGGLSGAL